MRYGLYVTDSTKWTNAHMPKKTETLGNVQTIDNRILKYLDIRTPISQQYKILPPEVE